MGNYHLAVDRFVERLNRESIFGGHEEPVVEADTVKLALAEFFNIYPPGCGDDDEVVCVLPIRPAIISG